MQLKRYSTKELIEVCKDTFYQVMSSSNTGVHVGNVKITANSGETIADALYNHHKLELEDNKERVRLYQESLNAKILDREQTEVVKREMQYLLEEQEILKNLNMETQKARHKRSNTLDYSRSCIRYSLDKLINSYYDNLYLEVVFYDNVSTLNGKHSSYAELDTREDKELFIKTNTEITNMSLNYFNAFGTRSVIIELVGKVNKKNSLISSSSLLALSNKYSDFSALTLKDTMSINNNDIKQFFQDKIDLDKENMKLLADKVVRGDNYKIYQGPNSELFIRYICPSTGRVYYNILNKSNLSLSKYYKRDKYETYIDAWWNINNLGAPLEGEPIIRC